MAVSLVSSSHAMRCIDSSPQSATPRVGHTCSWRRQAQFGAKKFIPPAARVPLSASPFCRNLGALPISAQVLSIRNPKIGAFGGGFFGKIFLPTLQRRVSGLVQFYGVRAGIERKEEEEGERAVSGFEVRGDDFSHLAVSLPLGLASFEGLYLAGWVASLRGLLPGSRGFFGAADLILCGVMFANCVVGWYALEQSRSEIEGLKEGLKGKRGRKVKAAGPGLVEMGFSLAVSFIPFANLFLWLKFATRQRHLPAKAKAALVANALIYEAPRLFSLLLLFSGGLWVFLQVGLVGNVAFLLSALHRPFEEARVKNEKVLMEAPRAKTMGGKKVSKPKEISPEEKERIDRMKELEEFDMLLAQRSPSGTALLPAKAKEWTVGETMEWLGQEGFARYATTFAENHIDGQLLLQLTNDDLRDELKILSFGDRRKLELLIQRLRER